MKVIFSGKLKWGNTVQSKSECELRVYQNKQTQQMIAVVSPVDHLKSWNNVTGFIALANEVKKKVESLNEKTIWIEYFPEGGGHSEAFDLVGLQWEGSSFHSPQRRRILRNFAEELAGSEIKTD